VSNVYRDFFDTLFGCDMLEYGSVIGREEIHKLLGIKMPDVGTKAEFDRVTLIELAAIGYVRNELMKMGRYITGTPTGYRVLLPSENAKQVELYIESASRKLSRAQTLSKNTPKEYKADMDRSEARSSMMKDGLRSRFMFQ
jgi:hypothetical protein